MSGTRTGFWRSAATYFGGAIGIQAVNFIAQPLFANLMPPSEVALVAVFLFWSSLVGLLVSLQLGTSLNNVISLHGDDAISAYFNSFVTFFTLVTVAAVAVVAVLPDSWILLSGLPKPLFILATAAGWGTAVTNAAMSRTVASRQPAAYIRLSAGVTVGGIIAGLILVLAMPAQPGLGRIIGVLVATFAAAVVFLIRYRWRPGRDFRSHLAFGVAITAPLLLHEVLSLLINQSNRIFLVNAVGAEQTGVFTFAWTMGSVVALAGVAVNNAWIPWYFRALDAADTAEVIRQGKRVVWLMGLGTTLLVLVSPEVLLLVNKAYAGGAALIPIAVATGLLTFLFNFAGNAVVYHRRTPLLLWASVPAAAINLSANAALVPQFGVLGAILATTSANAVLMVIAMVIHRWVLKAHHLSMWSVAAVLAITAAATGTSELLLTQPLWRWSVAIALSVGIGALLLVQLRRRRAMIPSKD